MTQSVSQWVGGCFNGRYIYIYIYINVIHLSMSVYSSLTESSDHLAVEGLYAGLSAEIMNTNFFVLRDANDMLPCMVD